MHRDQRTEDTHGPTLWPNKNQAHTSCESSLDSDNIRRIAF